MLSKGRWVALNRETTSTYTLAHCFKDISSFEMHFSPIILSALLAGAAQAAPAPEPEPWCWRPGQPCWKVKRATDAFSVAIRSSGGLQERTPEADYSNAPGGAAYMTKRSVNELANVVALATREPEAYYKGLGLNKEFFVDDGKIDKREASPDPWCWRPGQPCWKRDSTDDDVSVKDKRWCVRPGEPCWKTKRAADSVLEAIDKDEAANKDASDAAPFHFPESCDGPRVLCWKKREANPEPWCWRPGEPCWKAKRDLQAIQAVARSISESHQ